MLREKNKAAGCSYVYVPDEQACKESCSVVVESLTVSD